MKKKLYLTYSVPSEIPSCANKFFQKVFAVIFFVSFISCNGLTDNLPNINDVRKNLEENIFPKEPWLFQIVSIDKTNAVKRNEFGMDYYSIEYRMIIQFTHTAWYYTGFENREFKFYEKPAWKPDIYFKWIKKSVGDTMSYNESMSFEKYENGWRPVK